MILAAAVAAFLKVEKRQTLDSQAFNALSIAVVPTAWTHENPTNGLQKTKQIHTDRRQVH